MNAINMKVQSQESTKIKKIFSDQDISTTLK